MDSLRKTDSSAIRVSLISKCICLRCSAAGIQVRKLHAAKRFTFSIVTFEIYANHFIAMEP